MCERRIQHEYPPIIGQRNHWEFEHPKTGKIEYVCWDIENILVERMRGGGVLHSASWERCLKRYAVRVSLSKLNLIKKSPEWLDAVSSYVRKHWIVFNSRRRAEKIFGVSTETSHKIVNVSLDVKAEAYKKGKSVNLVTPNWNDHWA